MKVVNKLIPIDIFSYFIHSNRICLNLYRPTLLNQYSDQIHKRFRYWNLEPKEDQRQRNYYVLSNCELHNIDAYQQFFSIKTFVPVVCVFWNI